jgi:hypothetical protein
MILPLVFMGKSQLNLNLSRSLSLSILDESNHELPIQTTVDRPIEFMIPRDPNLFIPPMIPQDVTSTNDIEHNQLFYLKFINITSILPVSVHFEIRPLNISLAYLFIYKFDQAPVLNTLMNFTDGWSLFCPADLTDDNLYTYFISNQQTIDHQSIIFGLRELNSIEMEYICSEQSVTVPPIIDERYDFTSDYDILIYTSGCYYLDLNNNWQSNGLVVRFLVEKEKFIIFIQLGWTYDKSVSNTLLFKAIQIKSNVSKNEKWLLYQTK